MTVNNLSTKLGKAQSIDLSNQFGESIKKLIDMLKLERRLKLSVGSTIKTYKSTVTLDGATVAPGDVIPLSKVETVEGEPVELVWDKKRVAVPAEAIQSYGFEQAISNTDVKLLREQQKEIKKKFFAQLAKGTTSVAGAGLKGAMAKAWGSVNEKFEDDEVYTVAFVNPSDVADYLASASITINDAFGLKYVQNFMGVDVAVISAQVPAKTLYATASDNLILAYADMGAGEISKVFDFTTDETGFIGVTHNVDKKSMTAETVTASAMTLFAERLDGIVKVTINEIGA